MMYVPVRPRFVPLFVCGSWVKLRTVVNMMLSRFIELNAVVHLGLEYASAPPYSEKEFGEFG